MVQKSLLLLLLFLLAGWNHADASIYSIPEIRVDVQVLEDGTLQFTEQRTYRFDGSFSWADYRLPKSGYDEIRNIQVSEQDRNYINENSEDVGTFSVSESKNAFTIKWHYSAADTIRTFTLSYELAGALVIGPEYTDFLWDYLASGREKSTRNFELFINLPGDVSTDQIYAWNRSPSEKTSLQIDGGGLNLTGENLYRNESVRLRTAFPTSLLSSDLITISKPDLTLDQIIRNEQNYTNRIAEQEERDAFIQSIVAPVSGVIAALSIAIFVLLYLKYGKRHKIHMVADQDTLQIPDRTPPALTGKLLYYNYSAPQHLIATVFDLARRGWFIMEEEEEKKKGMFSSEEAGFTISRTDSTPESDLPEWEMLLVRTIEENLVEGKDKFHEIFNLSKTEPYKMYQTWNKEVQSVYDDKGWIDQVSKRGLGWNIAAQVILMGLSIYLLIMSGSPIALFGLMTSAFMAIGSATIPRRTPEGEKMYQRWKNYYNGLKNAKEHEVRMGTLDRHFIYATAFQLSKKRIETILESNDEVMAIFPWILFIPGSTRSPAEITSSVTKLAATGTSTFSGAGSGGGASFGSVGGGASGGAG